MTHSYIEVIEDAIRKHLHREINPDGQSNAVIETYPDKPDEYKLAHATAALLIRYAGSKTIERYSAGLTKLEAMFEVTILTRRYRDGVMHIANIRNKLRHFAPFEDYTQYKLCTHSDGFIKYTDGKWQHYVRFSILLFDPFTVQGMMI